MDKVEILYEAYKEAYLQSRRTHRTTLLIGLFSFLVIMLVVRDVTLQDTAGPRIVQSEQRLVQIEQQLAQHDGQKFAAPRSYIEARAAHNSARLAVDGWHNNLPARKKMQERYDTLLKEYSGSHDKVLERLRIDGEPGLNLYTELKGLELALAQARAALGREESKLEQLKEAFQGGRQQQRQQLQHDKERLQQEITSLRAELDRLQNDDTRLPWLGLRVNPRDLLSLVPILLWFMFHILFDKFDEILSLVRNPTLREVRKELQAFPSPVFFNRGSAFSLVTMLILYGLIPLVQVSAVVLIYQLQIGMLGLGPNSWQLAGAIGIVACLISLAYPVSVFRKHREVIMGHTR